MSRPFVVRRRERPDGQPLFAVVNTRDAGRPVAEFDRREAAEDHAAKLNAGPLDWDDQKAWQDDDWGEGDWGEGDRGGADRGGADRGSG